MTKHAKLGASKTKWWMHCPGAQAYLEAHPVEDKTTRDAQLGTAAHFLVEMCFEERSQPERFLGHDIVVPDEGDLWMHKPTKQFPSPLNYPVFTVDTNMTEAAQNMIDYVRARLKELGLKESSLKCEQHVVPLPERDDTGGTADIIIDAWPQLLEVVDYKHGVGVFVPVERNAQLRSYALGALNELGNAARDYETVRYTICQPRHSQAPHDGIMFEETTPAELLEWKRVLAAHAQRVDDARMLVGDGANLDRLYELHYLSIGEDGSHCTFCPLKAQCPALFDLAQDTAMVDFDDEPTDIPTSDLSKERRQKALKWGTTLKKWIDAVWAQTEADLLSGGKAEGFKVVRGGSYRQWNPELDESEVVETLISDYGLKRDQLYEDQDPKFTTGPKAEKLVPKAKRKEFNQDFLTKTEGKLVMVPESDKKPAVNIDPEKDFDGVED